MGWPAPRAPPEQRAPHVGQAAPPSCSTPARSQAQRRAALPGSPLGCSPGGISDNRGVWPESERGSMGCPPLLHALPELRPSLQSRIIASFPGPGVPLELASAAGLDTQGTGGPCPALTQGAQAGSLFAPERPRPAATPETRSPQFSDHLSPEGPLTPCYRGPQGGPGRWGERRQRWAGQLGKLPCTLPPPPAPA